MNKDQVLKEARTLEAMQKGYMGLEGKFSFIASQLGNPSYRQGSPMFSQTFLEDYSSDEEDIPTMDEEEDSYHIGFYFDGLSSGINLTILVLTDTREITCRFDGKVVYKEVAGELEGFAPEEVWEKHLKNLFGMASKKERRNKPQKRKEMVEMANKERKRQLDHLRAKWGL